MYGALLGKNLALIHSIKKNSLSHLQKKNLRRGCKRFRLHTEAVLTMDGRCIE